MKKLIKFKPNAKTYLDIAEDCYDRGELDNAIFYFFKSYKKKQDISTLIAIGETYCEMGQPEEGLKYLLMALDKDPDDTDTCHSIAQSFLDMDDEETAFFYYHPRMTVKRFRHLMEESEREDIEASGIRMLEKNDDMVVGIAVKLLSSGDISYAREILLTVKPESDNYISACNLLSLSALELEKPDEALDYAQKALAIKENVDCRCNMMLAYFMQGKTEDADRIMDSIESQKIDIAGHKTVSLAYIRMGKADKAAAHLKVLVENSKYNRDALVSYALALYNIGQLQQAKQYIVTACKIYPNDIAAREIAAAISRGDKLSLFPLLEDEVATRWIAEIESKLSEVRQDNDFFSDSDFADKIAWLFQSRFVSRQTRAAITLGRLKNWRGFFRELLLDNCLDLAVKKVCLFSLLLGWSDDALPDLEGGLPENITALPKKLPAKRLGIVLDGMYSSLRVRFPRGMNRPFAAAYCLAFSSFAFSDSGFEDRLLSAANSMLDRYIDAIMDLQETETEAFSEICTEDILAAAIFCHAGHKQIEGTASAAQLFGCDHDKLNRLLEKFDIDMESAGASRGRKQSKK